MEDEMLACLESPDGSRLYVGATELTPDPDRAMWFTVEAAAWQAVNAVALRRNLRRWRVAILTVDTV
jgi:hypothetical protein